MREYRKRFVELNMLLLGLVLLVMMAAVAFYMYRDYYSDLRATMEQVVEPLAAFGGESVPPGPPPDLAKPGGPKAREAHRGIMTVFYEPRTGDISILSQTTLVEGEALDAVLGEITARPEPFGTLRERGLIYYRGGSEQLYKIAIAPTGYITNSMLELSVLLALVWLLAMLLLLGVSVQLSKLAVRPMAQAMEREKQFIADASHDLKTPLSVILANNSVLRENPQATIGSQQKWIDSTETAAGNMRRLIEEMLTLSDAERAQVPLSTETVDVSSLVTRAVLQMESIAYEKGVELENEIEEGVTLCTNADYLERIAASLMENAIKYEPAGGAVRVCLTAAGQQVHLSVGNRHSVIAQEDLPHIFERFYRADKSRRSQGGHGLGLAIAKEMTRRLGGTLRVESGEKLGTVFTATLPLSARRRA